MLKTNVITTLYRVTLRTGAGKETAVTLHAESEAAARLKAPCPDGWTVTQVVPL